MRGQRKTLVLGLGIALLGTGCASTKGGQRPAHAPSQDLLTPKGTQEGNSVPELRQRIHRLRVDQRAQAAAAQADAEACETVCTLATQICGATEKLCDLAQRHPQDESFQGLCREAQQECRAATLHCENCAGGLEEQTLEQAPSTEPPEESP